VLGATLPLDGQTETAAARGRSVGEPLLRPEAVARLLACSPKTVYAWAARGSIPCVRLGRLVRFRPGDVRRFVEAHKAKAGNAHRLA
jgi:excisionase family DNA binding protein